MELFIPQKYPLYGMKGLFSSWWKEIKKWF